MRISMAVAAVAAVVVAVPAHAQSLAGSWQGTFTNDITKKSGQLILTLAGTDDAATGQMMLTPVKGKVILAEGATPVKGKPAGLTVAAMLSGDKVSGSVDGSYVDPGCNCSVVSTFEGALEGNTIVGTISARDARTGQWNFTSFTASKGGKR